MIFASKLEKPHGSGQKRDDKSCICARDDQIDTENLRQNTKTGKTRIILTKLSLCCSEHRMLRSGFDRSRHYKASGKLPTQGMSMPRIKHLRVRPVQPLKQHRNPDFRQIQPRLPRALHAALGMRTVSTRQDLEGAARVCG